MFDESAVKAGVIIAETNSEVQKTKPIILQGSFSSNQSVYQLHLKSDGIGKIIYSDFPEDFEEFDHEIEVIKLAQEIEEEIQSQIVLQSQAGELSSSEIEEIRSDTATDILADVFWEQINQTLEDPFFRSFYDDDWGEEFRCEQGTVEELTDFLKLCVLTERTIEDVDDFLIVEAENDFDTAGLSDCSYRTERLAELVEIACRYYEPKGFTYDYNDGCYDRMSGYSMSSDTISVSLAEFVRVPVRKRMLSMKELRRRLAIMAVPFEKIEQLATF